ncbi:MAG: hypothetical protein PVJ69_15730 [Desulfobacteraceae bacterium]|jgi:hypothetical protein
MAVCVIPAPEAVSLFNQTVIPGEPKDVGRDPWFDRLTTLSEVEGESRKIREAQIILDPGSHPTSVFAEASPDRPRDLAGMTNYDRASKAGI